METPQEQLAAFDQHWPAMKEAAESGGAEAVIAYVRSHDVAMLRRVLWSFARKGLVMSDWDGKDVETPLRVALAGVDELVRSAHIQTDADVAAKRLNVANVIAWHGAADVADCWPGEDLPRTPEQLAAALDLASRCVAWRQQLGKGPHARAMGHWLHGYLLLRNDRAEEALDALEASELLYREATQDTGKALAACDFPVVLAHGYVGIAHAALGRGRDAHDAALTVFRGQESAGGDNGAFGRRQLETAWTRVVG